MQVHRTWDAIRIVNNDANFRAYFTPLFDAIEACGWVQTADTGQANPATAARTTTAGTHYRVYRTGSALQAQSPVVVRFEWYSTTQSWPMLRIQAGNASDGAGTVTRINPAVAGGAAWTAIGTAWSDGGAPSAVAVRSYVSGDEDSLLIVLGTGLDGVSDHNATGLLIIERIRTFDGESAPGSYMVVNSGWSSPGTNPATRIIYTHALVPEPQNSTQAPSMAFGVPEVEHVMHENIVRLQPWLTGHDGFRGGGVSRLAVAYWGAHLPVGTEFLAPMYGINHRFRALNIAGAMRALGSSNPIPGYRVAIPIGEV